MSQPICCITKKITQLYLLFILVFLTVPLLATTYDFEVTVIDEYKNPLIGVNVYTDDYSFTAVTALNGKVRITNLDYRQEVNFTYVGYESLKIPFFQIKKKNGNIQMFPNSKDLKTIVVVGRRDDMPEDIPFIVEHIDQKEIAFTNPQTTADALSSHANVFVQKSQMGGGSPVIRGFEANKVLLVLDGVRLNNAIYREGHLQNAITVDNSMLERVEVIYGPGSLTYGSDALGGVVHFRSKDPKLYFPNNNTGQQGMTETTFYTRFASANEEKTAHLHLNYGSKHWASLTSFTFTDYNHLRAGSQRPTAYPNFGKRYHFAVRDEVDQINKNVILKLVEGDTLEVSNSDVQIGTEYSQLDLTQKVKYQANDQLYFVGNIQYSTSSNIPRYDQLTEFVKDSSDLKFSEWYYGPQQRILTSLKTRILGTNRFYNKATIIAAFQKIDEERYKRKFAKTHRDFNIEDVYVYSLTADLDKYLDAEKRKVLSYGLDVTHNRVKSMAGQTNIRTGAVSFNEPTRYPSGGSTTFNAAIYTNYRWKSPDSLLSAHFGARYTYAKIHSLFSQLDPIPWPEVYYTEGVGNTESDLTWGLGLTYNTKNKWQLRLLAASAFRSPNIDDFSKVRVKNGYVTIPNPSLGSERAITGEMTLAKELGELKNVGEKKSGIMAKLSITGFYTRLNNAIVRQNFALPNGASTLLIDEEINTTQANVNAQNAFVYGTSANVLVNISDQWKLQSGINFTKGRQLFRDTILDVNTDLLTPIDTLVPMAHIPPMYGQTSLSYQHKKFRIEGVLRYNGVKLLENYAVTSIEIGDGGETILNRGGSSDNPEQATKNGTYAWMTYNLYTSWQFKPQLSLNFAVENIADIHYRPFASGISAAGRNFIVSLRGEF